MTTLNLINDRTYMELAISEMQKCDPTKQMVGAVLVKDNTVIAVGRRENSNHAERNCIESALGKGVDIRGATLYSTLEPCVEVTSKRECCSDLISRVGISRVFIGRYDRHPYIYRRGWKRLNEANIELKDFESDFREQIDVINEKCTDHFLRGYGPEGGAKFDFSLNEGLFDIQFSPDDERTIQTKWSIGGIDTIHAYTKSGEHVALAKFAPTFNSIDDPAALDLSNHVVTAMAGEIVAFISPEGSVLVKVIEVESGPTHGCPHISLKIAFQVRPNKI